MQATHPGFTAQRQAVLHADGVRRPMMFSFGVHVLVVVGLFALPRDWFVREKPVQIPMTLAMGPPGEKTGGQTAAGAQPIEQVAPPPKRPAPLPVVTPPKADPNAITTKTPVKTPPKPTETASVPNPVTRPPTTGAKVTPGTAAAATGATGINQGLSVGGGPGGTVAKFDSDFCCPAYAEEVLRRIGVIWQPKGQQESGETIVVFEIRKDGSFTSPQVEKSSGSVALDIASRAAFVNLRLPPLPDQYSGQTLKIHLVFPYNR